MFERVTVVGAGAAGLAAVWAAARRGAEIRLFDAGVGASGLGGGAVDDQPWEQVARAAQVLMHSPAAGPLPPSVRLFATELDLWRLGDQGNPLVRLATEAGRVRLARGCDRALLDLSRLPAGARVLLPRASRSEWDADALARALGADAYADSRRLSFVPVDARILEYVGEDRIAAAELASRHDDPARLGWLGERLREMLARHGHADAVLLGPWLGADRPRSGALSELAGVRVGEILGGVGSAAGLRFEAARLRMLSSVGVTLEPCRATAVRRVEDGFEVALDGAEPAASDAVVLALGGLVSGGVRFDPPEQSAGLDMAAAARCSFQLSLSAPVRLQVDGRALDVGSSINGPALDQLAWPSDADPGYLELVGVACDGEQCGERLFAAGDVVADRPRTLLQAVHSGIRAGAAAAGEPGMLG